MAPMAILEQRNVALKSVDQEKMTMKEGLFQLEEKYNSIHAEHIALRETIQEPHKMVGHVHKAVMCSPQARSYFNDCHRSLWNVLWDTWIGTNPKYWLSRTMMSPQAI